MTMDRALDSPPDDDALAAPMADVVHPHDGDMAVAAKVVDSLRQKLRSVIRGRDETIDLVILALLADGHILLEDYPGSGKTTLARALGEAIQTSPKDEEASEHAADIAAFRRIQFTPDLLPSDITGTSIFDIEGNRFVFQRGPLFAHVVLADEINRTSPKVQSAMLEAMAEKQVTVDNVSHRLDDLFFVIATQNPLDLAGTYPLPTPQLDRFLFKIRMGHIDREAELSVLDQYPVASLDHAEALPDIGRADVMKARAAIRRSVEIKPGLKQALVDTARALREDERVLQGVSTRSLVLMLPALQAQAVMNGRDFVTPDDLAFLAPFVFEHRLECAPGIDDERAVIEQCLAPEIDRLAKATIQGLP